jgi:hypothetical protein
MNIIITPFSSAGVFMARKKPVEQLLKIVKILKVAEA